MLYGSGMRPTAHPAFSICGGVGGGPGLDQVRPIPPFINAAAMAPSSVDRQYSDVYAAVCAWRLPSLADHRATSNVNIVSTTTATNGNRSVLIPEASLFQCS